MTSIDCLNVVEMKTVHDYPDINQTLLLSANISPSKKLQRLVMRCFRHKKMSVLWHEWTFSFSSCKITIDRTVYPHFLSKFGSFWNSEDLLNKCAPQLKYILMDLFVSFGKVLGVCQSCLCKNPCATHVSFCQNRSHYCFPNVLFIFHRCFVPFQTNSIMPFANIWQF